MLIGQLRPRVTPQISLNVDSMLLNSRIATYTSMIMPATPSVPPRMFWMNEWIACAASFCAFAMRVDSAAGVVLVTVTNMILVVATRLVGSPANVGGAPFVSGGWFVVVSSESGTAMLFVTTAGGTIVETNLSMKP